jgi:hypothetical protein
LRQRFAQRAIREVIHQKLIHVVKRLTARESTHDINASVRSHRFARARHDAAQQGATRTLRDASIFEKTPRTSHRVASKTYIAVGATEIASSHARARASCFPRPHARVRVRVRVRVNGAHGCDASRRRAWGLFSL